MHNTQPVEMTLSLALFLIVVLGPNSVFLVSSQQPPKCGDKFETFKFQLLSPGFPQKFLQENRCEFEVIAASDLVCGLKIDFSTLVLPACPSEWLLVEGRTICGPHDRVIHIPFLQSQANITFKQSPNRDAAFNITVQQIECKREDNVEECGGQFLDDIVVIHSPGYPLGYPSNLYCHYIIMSTDPSVCMVEIAFSDSALQASPNCIKDSLILEKHRMCGPLEGVVVLSMGRMFDIKFITDDKISNKGFNMTVRQKRCQNSLSPMDILQQNEKQDTLDSQPHSQLGSAGIILQEGYPVVKEPFPPFSLPTNWEELQGGDQNVPLEEEPPIEPPFQQYSPATFLNDCNLQLSAKNSQDEKRLSIGYLPTDISQDEISLLGKQNSITVSPFQQNEPQFKLNYDRRPSTVIASATLQNIPSQNYIPPNSQPRNFPPSDFSLNRRFPSSPSTFPVLPSLQQCCGNIYSDNHFLIISPNFPKSQSYNCIFTLSRFTPITNQLLLRFRYFFVGEDTSEGCSGGFLEIDGTRICGCKTGLLLTSQFVDSENVKILHLKIDSSSNKLINGFIIEVFQDEPYLQRFKRLSDNSGVYGKEGSLTNVNQYIETTVERSPFFVSNGNYPFQGFSVWDSFKPWRLQTDAPCLQWCAQDWPIFLKTTLLSEYQCTANNDVILDTVCRSCQYFCRQNCKCCQK